MSGQKKKFQVHKLCTSQIIQFVQIQSLWVTHTHTFVKNMIFILSRSVVAAAVAVAILSSSCFVVQPIFAFEIDQSENKHQQSIKSAAIDELVASSSAVAAAVAINQEHRHQQSSNAEDIDDVHMEEEDDEEESESADSVATINGGAPTKTTLQTDLFEFIDLIPVDEVNELKVRYYVSDPKVRQAFDYLKSYDYSFVHRDLCELHAVKRAVAFMEGRGMNLTEVGYALYDRFGPPNASITAAERK